MTRLKLSDEGYSQKDVGELAEPVMSALAAGDPQKAASAFGKALVSGLLATSGHGFVAPIAGGVADHIIAAVSRLVVYNADRRLQEQVCDFERQDKRDELVRGYVVKALKLLQQGKPEELRALLDENYNRVEVNSIELLSALFQASHLSDTRAQGRHEESLQQAGRLIAELSAALKEYEKRAEARHMEIYDAVAATRNALVERSAEQPAHASKTSPEPGDEPSDKSIGAAAVSQHAAHHVDGVEATGHSVDGQAEPARGPAPPSPSTRASTFGWRRAALFASLGVAVLAGSAAVLHGRELIENGGFEQTERNDAGFVHWTRGTSLNALLAVSDRAFSGSRSAFVSASAPRNVGWEQTVRVQRDVQYRLSGWIRMQDVLPSPEISQDGANIGYHCTNKPAQFAARGDLGTHDWFHVELVFNSEQCELITVSAKIGQFAGQTTGMAWFDEVSLVRE